MSSIRNININDIKPLLSPEMVMHQLPSTVEVNQHIESSRRVISDILQGRDKRFLAIVGPCSVHDEKSALEYAQKLHHLAEQVSDSLYIVMRVYFEKPRTTVGWKGLINDPYLDDSLAINDGLLLARKLLLSLNQLGVVVATEFVDTITPQYISDLVSWAAIGARTTESQPHRTLASGLSMPVGFKNNTSGDVSVAVNAVMAAKNSHRFLSVTEQGLAAIVDTKGNANCHIILRGGTPGANYQKSHVNKACELLAKEDLPLKLLIDCSHANCAKDHKRQIDVINDISQQIEQGDGAIMGMMLESHLQEGKQTLTKPADLEYGKSITDPCLGWPDTEKVILKLAADLRKTRHGK